MNEHDPEKVRERLGRRLCAFWQGKQGLLLSVSGYFSQEAKQGVLPAHAHGAREALHVGDLSRFFPRFEQIFRAEALHPFLDYKMHDVKERGGAATRVWPQHFQALAVVRLLGKAKS